MQRLLNISTIHIRDIKGSKNVFLIFRHSLWETDKQKKVELIKWTKTLIMTNLAQCQMAFLCTYKCKSYHSKIEALQNCWYFLSVLSVAWNSTKLTLFLKVKLTKTHIEPNFNCKRLQKWQQTWWSFFGFDKNNWNSQIHPGNTNVRTICLHLWHASVVACHVIL